MTKSLLITFSAFLLFSCKEDTTPSWLEIPAFNLTTDEAIEGVNSHGISDAWVYMDGKAIGVFEIPCRIPILAEGEHSFVIYAGIKQHGISARRMKYPFFERFEGPITLIKGETVTLTPSITYKSNLNFVLIEDFESPGMEFEDALISQTSMVFVDKTTNPDIVKYGFRCGGVFLNETDSLYKGLTSAFLDLPKNEDVFLEIDFLTNNTMVTSTIAQNSVDYLEEVPLAQMNPPVSDTIGWRRIYIDLRENVSFRTTASSYEIYLLALLDEGNTTASIYLDNIKVICYQ